MQKAKNDSGCSRPNLIQEFRSQIRSIRPFNRDMSQSILNKFIEIDQFTKNIPRQIRQQINLLHYSVIELQEQFIIFDILYIYNS